MDDRKWHAGSSRLRIVVDARISRRWDAGVGRYTESLLRALAPYGHDLVLLTNAHGDPPSDLATETGIRVVPSSVPIASLRQHTLLPLSFRRMAADVILSTHPLAATFFSPCPAVAVILDVYPLHFPEQFPRPVAPYYRTVFRSIARRRPLIAISEATKRDAVELLGVRSRSIAVTHLAADEHFRSVPPGAMRSTVLARYGATGRYVLYHGNKRPHKNVVGLVRAFASVHRGMPDVRLVITGRHIAGDRECDQTDIRREASQLGIIDSLVFTGYVEDRDLPCLYSAADMTAVPSLLEGFGLTALESMACGTPVVASSAGSLPEVVGDTGILIDPRRTDALAEAITRLLRDGGLRALLAERATQRAATFSWSRTARLTLDVLERNATRRS